MEEAIQKVNNLLKKCYIAFWLLPIIIAVCGELDWITNGLFADNFKMCYYFDFFDILITASFIPIALKLFQWTLVKHIDKLSFPIALHKYATLSIIRIALIAFALVFDMCSYYLTLSNTGIFCAGITIIAVLFCIPSDKRLREELQISKSER